jgi:hypothetical protein
MCSRGGDGTTTGGERTFWTSSGMSVVEGWFATRPWQKLTGLRTFVFELIGHAPCSSVRACLQMLKPCNHRPSNPVLNPSTIHP